jgi:DNA-binding Xre family transcriptional regulator
MRVMQSRSPDPAAGPPGVYTARGQVAGEDWTAVAHALNQRMAALRIGQQELTERSGVSVSTVRQLQHGAGRRVQNRTLAAISTALDWPEDHLTGLLLAGRGTTSATTLDGADPVLDLLGIVVDRLDQVTARLDRIEGMLRPADR